MVVVDWLVSNWDLAIGIVDSRTYPRGEADRGPGVALPSGADEQDRVRRDGPPDQLLLHQIQRRRQCDLAAGPLLQGRRLHQVPFHRPRARTRSGRPRSLSACSLLWWRVWRLTRCKSAVVIPMGSSELMAVKRRNGPDRFLNRQCSSLSSSSKSLSAPSIVSSPSSSLETLLSFATNLEIPESSLVVWQPTFS